VRVLFAALGTVEEACTRVRIHQHVPGLRSRGIEATVVPFYPRPPASTRPAAAPRRPAPARRLAHAVFELCRTLRIARLARDHDAVVLQRVLLPPALQRMLARHSRRLLFDFDDAIYTTHAGALPVPPDTTFRFEHMLSLADAAIVSTAHLAGRARPHTGRVFVVPSPVDCERYRPRPDLGPRNEVTIGWIGRDSTTMYLTPVLPVLAELCRSNPRVRVALVGALAGTGAGFAECPPWSLDTELGELARFDVGIMPLTDDEWARGKGGYKLLQYFACGVPAVASPVGANREIVTPGETGFLAADAVDWREHLSRLIRDATLRARLAATARVAAKSEYSLAKWTPRLADALEETVEAAPNRRALRR
jgi:glycosyltransferase involved in cell wall biosynthesis